MMNNSIDLDYSKKWLVLVSVGMGVFLATIDSSIVNITLPTLVESFHTDFPTVQWVVLAYLLTLSTLLLSAGRLADMKGKKAIYMAGLIVFTLGSLLCGLSTSVYLLIAFRVLQGIGGTMTMALGAAIITEAFPPSERGRALGINGAIVSLGAIVGPSLGGIILGALTWHWVFFVNLPLGLIAAFMVTRYVPNFKPHGNQQFDYFGATSMFVGLLCLLLALTIGQNTGFSAPVVLGLFAGFAICLVIFIYVENHSPDPMVDLSLFRQSLLTINLVTSFITFVSMAGIIILMPFFLENILHFNVSQVGLLMVVNPIVMGISAPISGSLSDRFGSRLIAVVGLGILLVGYLAITTLGEQTTSLTYILCLAPVGLGMGIFQSPNNSAIMGSSPRERLGVVSSMISVTRTLGQTSGIAVLGAVWASRVFFHAGGATAGGATAAPTSAQVGALHDTALGIVVMITIALGLSIWALIEERSQPTVKTQQTVK